MNLLFLHPNFPGQFKNLAAALAAREGTRVVGLGHCSASWRALPGVDQYHYGAFPPPQGPPYAPVDLFAQQVRRGRAAAEVMCGLADDGFVPDVAIVHPGWGDAMFLHDAFPKVPVVAFLEFYYRRGGADLDFDPEFPVAPAETEFLRLRNLPSLLAFETAAAAVSPTNWQAGLFPELVRRTITVLHEGVDTDALAPEAVAAVTLPDGRTVTAGDEVLSYVARGLEPLRGFHCFMRALPELQRRRPGLVTVIVGDDEVHYGRRPPGPGSWRQRLLAELGDRLDLSRIWFAGRLPFATYRDLMRLTTVHTYLTYPFVLSWSLVEAMAAGRAIVASRTPPVEEAIDHGEHGLLVDFFDRDGLVEAIAGLLADPERRLFLGRNARLRACRRYDFRRCALPAYDALIATVTATDRAAGCPRAAAPAAG